jgi:2-dehydro-3-deoxygluconokinase
MRMTTIVGYGEPLQENRPDDSGKIFLGGDISNILVGACRLLPVLSVAAGRDRTSVNTKILTAVGDDTRGNALIELYKEAGIQTDMILRIPGKKTGAYELVRSRAGDDRKLNYQFFDREDSAARYLFAQCNESMRAFLTQAGQDTIFVTTGIAISRPINAAAFDNFLGMIDEAKAKGVTIIFNTELRLPLFGGDQRIAAQRINALWQRAQIVFCSYPDDVAIFPFANGTRENVKDYILQRGANAVIISEGEQALRLYQGAGSELHLPALEITDSRGIVDTAGGSAALTAGTVAARAIGLPLERAVRISLLLARNVMSILGGVPPAESIPSLEELRAELSSR